MRELRGIVTVNKPEWVKDEQLVSLLNQLADNIEYYEEQATGEDGEQAQVGDPDFPPPPPLRVAGATDQEGSSQRHRRESHGDALDF